MFFVLNKQDDLLLIKLKCCKNLCVYPLPINYCSSQEQDYLGVRLLFMNEITKPSNALVLSFSLVKDISNVPRETLLSHLMRHHDRNIYIST